MLHKRVVACLVIKNNRVVQSIGFEKYLPVGSPHISVEFLNRWGIDEVILLDIDAAAENRQPDFEMVTESSQKGFVPLTVGGGIKSIDDMRKLIHCGADKVSINKVSLKKPAIIGEAAAVFGSQCIVVSMDVKNTGNGKYEVFSDSGKNSTGLNPVSWAREIESLGAGEILLNSVDRDGMKNGYDLKLISSVADAVTIPIIACGGVGHPEHFLEGLTKGNASAVAAGNFFHFTEHSPVTAKAYLKKQGIDVRLDTYSNYEGAGFKKSGRISKMPEDYLEELRFEIIPEEVI